MSSRAQKLSDQINDTLSTRILSNEINHGEVTIELSPDDLIDVCTELRDAEKFHFEQLLDICGVDYSEYGCTEWATEESTSTGFSRGVDSVSHARLKFGDEILFSNDRKRFAVVYHLLSLKNNHRLRIRVYADNDSVPVVPSILSVWSSANWYEREAFDLYGIMFSGHPDLRRILTDYGFVGHPFRKDFPMVGHVEMKYDPEQKRVIYQPVSIEPRVLVPRVIRDETRQSNPDKTEDNDA